MQNLVFKADNVVDVCGPVLKCNRKGQGRGRHEFKSAPADRRRRQDSEQVKKWTELCKKLHCASSERESLIRVVIN